MKKLFLSILAPFTLFAEAFLVSNIPLPKTYIFNLDPYECNEKCLEKFLQKDMIFSFIAYANEMPQIKDKDLLDLRNMYISVFNIGSIHLTNDLKIAMLLPYKKIGKYATSTTNAVFAYLLERNNAFEMKSFQLDSESPEDITKALRKIEQERFYYVIAPLTLQGARNLAALQSDLKIFIPTINKNDIETTDENLYFGGIDYKAQSKKLLEEAHTPLVIFYDKSPTGQKLMRIQEEIFLERSLEASSLLNSSQNDFQDKIIRFEIASRTTNLEKELKDNMKLIDATVVLDTPLVKSGMILSQLTLYDIQPANKLSTQINYDPLIFSITQYEDRKDMIIANSITIKNNLFNEANTLLGNDIRFDWINYTTTVGIDYFFSLITAQQREYDIPLIENQMHYPIQLVEPSYSRFIPHYQEDLDPKKSLY